jgi:hypothetical protein
MNSHWMTTLLSKGKQAGSQLQNQLKKELESRGLRLSAADLAAIVEEISPMASRGALSSALDFLKPFSAGLGFRVSRLSDLQIELVIPARGRNLNEENMLHEGALISGGIEAAKMLWERHAPLGHFQCEVKSVQFESVRGVDREVRVRLEIPETSRENLLSQLRQVRSVTSDLSLRFVDEAEQTVANMNLVLNLRHTPSLEAPEG